MRSLPGRPISRQAVSVRDGRPAASTRARSSGRSRSKDSPGSSTDSNGIPARRAAQWCFANDARPNRAGIAEAGRRTRRFVPPSDPAGEATTGPPRASASVNSAAVSVGRSPNRTASAADRPMTSASSWRTASSRERPISETGRAPRRAAISSTTSSDETTQTSHATWARHASRTSSSIARVSAARSIGESTPESRAFVPSKYFTGTATTCMPGYNSRAFGGWERPVDRMEPWFDFVHATLRPPAALWFNWHFEGMEHIPREGAVLVACNHISYLDPIAHAYMMVRAGRRPRFLAKSELYHNWFLRQVLEGAHQIPVERGSGSSAPLDSAIQALKEGEAVMIYPEGTVTRNPDFTPMQGRTGVARLTLASEVPVLPIAVWGTQAVWQREGLGNL